jgi:hypothetical protein
MLCQGPGSVFEADFRRPRKCAQVPEDLGAMRHICAEHSLDDYYWEAGMALWQKIRDRYECDIFAFGALRYLALCLGLAVKFAGPKSTTHGYCTLRNMRRYWQYLSLERLQCEELRMCRLLNWEFR